MNVYIHTYLVSFTIPQKSWSTLDEDVNQALQLYNNFIWVYPSTLVYDGVTLQWYIICLYRSFVTFGVALVPSSLHFPNSGIGQIFQSNPNLSTVGSQSWEAIAPWRTPPLLAPPKKKVFLSNFLILVQTFSSNCLLNRGANFHSREAEAPQLSLWGQ